MNVVNSRSPSRRIQTQPPTLPDMDSHHQQATVVTVGNSVSSGSSPDLNSTTRNHNNHNNDPMQSWWESVSKARTRIHSLLSLLPRDHSLSSLPDSDRPARSLLHSLSAYAAVSSALAAPLSGSGDDLLCHWLYDTFQSSDPDLRLVVLSFVPLLAGIYLSRVHSFSTSDASAPSLAGFEAVLLALYASETKSRNGKPLLVSIPDLSQPSLYHVPRSVPTPNLKSSPPPDGGQSSRLPAVGVLSAPLEPQCAVKSTKRGCIVGVALDCFYKEIFHMPNWSKVELCRFAAAWAGDDCPCAHSLDRTEEDDEEEDAVSCTLSNGRISSSDAHEIQAVVEEMGRMYVNQDTASNPKGARIPLPWEMLQPILRILGHCLLAPLNSEEIKDVAAMAVRRLYARASHDLFPQAILATRSLIQLDNRARAAAQAAALANASSNASNPTKSKKPEVLLASK